MELEGIITADWHIRDDKPKCRNDADWFGFQKECIYFCINKANEYKVPLYIIGDLYDHPKGISNELMSMLIKAFYKCKKGIRFIAGNHDLINHSSSKIFKSNIGILQSLVENGGRIDNPSGYSWSHFNDLPFDFTSDIMFKHILVYKGINNIKGEGTSAIELLDLFKTARWIFTGDNHQAFVYSKSGRYVVNPGCLNRQSINEIDYHPSIYYVNTRKAIIERLFVPDDPSLLSNNESNERKDRDKSIQAFIDRVKHSKKSGLSILDNINKSMDGIDNNTKKFIKEIIEEVKNEG